MADSNRRSDFLSPPARDYPSDDDLERNHIRPALDTLFSEFARRHRSLSPSVQSSSRSIRAPQRQTQQHVLPNPSTIDLRSLDYALEYDSHLMCPICHIPFIDPVVLDCDHTFCASCFSEYRRGLVDSGRSHCPSCRTLVVSNPRKASRLIYNMCNDIKVQCPNEDCLMILARGVIERHATSDCPEYLLPCPGVKCEKQTKRKNYVPGQCVHDTSVECDCGAIIELGRGEWIRHKDEICPNTGFRCEKCGRRLSNKERLSTDHVCQESTVESQCPGTEYGCTDEVSAETLQQHTSTCPLARLAPHLKSQSRLLQTMQDQLLSAKFKNENLEAELERLSNLLVNQIQPRLESLENGRRSFDSSHDEHLHDNENDIEEIPRDNIPSAAAIHHRDLLLPAHIRDLTPSPDLIPASNGASYTHTYVQNQTHMHNHLLSLHEGLRHTVSNLETDINSLHHSLSELDARTSMQIMTETLRIREDLAYTHAALMSSRSQVQWLLNRERMGREQAHLRNRGRLSDQGRQNQGQGASEMERQGSGSSGGPQPRTQPESFPFPSPGAGMTRTLSGSGAGSAVSSTATSPVFSGVGLAGSGSARRPSIRGGSQERVKL